MLRHIINYVVLALIMLSFDVIWLKLMVPRIYAKSLAHLLADSPQLLPAALFYFIYALGVYVFVVSSALNAEQLSFFRVLALGALFGLVAYGTYDLTNHATLRDWPLKITLIDMTWGAAMTAVSSLLGSIVIRYFWFKP